MTEITEPKGGFLERADRAPFATIETLAPGDVLVLAPHADDETLGCGEAIIAARATGRRVAVALITDGGASHPRSLAHPRDALVRLRREEFRRAIARLGIDAPLTMLSFRDGESDGSIREADRMADGLAAALGDFRPGVIWTTWGRDPHCDHLAVSHAATRLGRRLDVPVRSYVVWGRFTDETPDGDLVRFSHPDANPAKRRAAACYRSQLTPMIDDDPDGFMMPPALTEHFLSTPELFVG